MTNDKQRSSVVEVKGNSSSRSPFVIRYAWLAYTLVTVLLWGCWGLVSKPVSDRMSAWQVQTTSCLGLLPVIGLLAAIVGTYLLTAELGKRIFYRKFYA